MMNVTFKIENTASFDVIVAGGGPAGIGAAISAALEGAKVLLIERAGIVGGCITIGHVSPLSGGMGKNTLAEKINSLIKNGNTEQSSFNVENAKICLTELLAKHNVTVYLNSAVTQVIKENDKIKSVIISTAMGLKAVSAKMFIDATGDGTLSFLSGEDYEIGRKQDGLLQPVSIMFTIGGIEKDKKVFCFHEEMDTVLKRGSFLQMCKEANLTGELPENVNIIRLYEAKRDDEQVVNATQQNRVDPLSEEQYSLANVELRRQMSQIVNFLRRNVEGYQNIYISDSAEVVGVRESRRIKGYYEITAEDLLAGRTFEDVVVHKTGFPIDIHNPDGAGQGETEGKPYETSQYDIPYKSLIPLKNKNLIVAGRCISGTHRAHASYRVMNICICMGEAAGIAAAICAKENISPIELGHKSVQEVLTRRGIELFD